MAKLFIILFPVLFFCDVIKAQTSLSEVGILIRPGVALSSAPELKSGFGFAISPFYTHYLCGKRVGYWFEGSYKNGNLSENQNSGISLNYNLAEAGAYLKLRSHRENRRNEFCLLVGPKFSFGNYSLKNTIGNAQNTSSFLFGAHASILYKQEIANKGSICFEPGTEWIQNNSAFFGINTGGFFVYFGVGYIFWKGL